MEKENKIQYIDRPDVKEFPDDDVAELVNILNGFDSIRSGTRHRIALALLREDPDDYHLVNQIDPACCPIEQMRKFRDLGNTIIAKDGERTVGMIGFEEHNRTASGQRVFEIRRTTVLKNYREKGIGRVLRESMIKRLAEIDSDALLLSRIHVDNEINRNLAESTKFTKISDSEMKDVGFSEDWIQDNKSGGYEFYIFDPRKENLKKNPDSTKQEPK